MRRSIPKKSGPDTIARAYTATFGSIGISRPRSRSKPVMTEYSGSPPREQPDAGWDGERTVPNIKEEIRLTPLRRTVITESSDTSAPSAPQAIETAASQGSRDVTPTKQSGSGGRWHWDPEYRDYVQERGQFVPGTVVDEALTHRADCHQMGAFSSTRSTNWVRRSWTRRKLRPLLVRYRRGHLDHTRPLLILVSTTSSPDFLAALIP